MTGSGRSATAGQPASACLMYSSACLAPFLEPIVGVYQIELAVDDGPGLRVHRVLVRRSLVRRAHRTITVVLRCVALRILDEQIAMLTAGKAPAQFAPDVFKLRLALNRSPVGEIGDRIVATDREPRFVASGGGSEQRHEKQAEQVSRRELSARREALHMIFLLGRLWRPGLPWPTVAVSHIVLIVYSEVKTRLRPEPDGPPQSRAAGFLSKAEACRDPACRCGRFQPPHG